MAFKKFMKKTAKEKIDKLKNPEPEEPEDDVADDEEDDKGDDEPEDPVPATDDEEDDEPETDDETPPENLPFKRKKKVKKYDPQEESIGDMKMPLTDEPIELTQEENAEYLGSVIRRQARWSFKPGDVPSLQANSLDEGTLGRIAAKVYDSLVGEYNFNKTLVKATRAVDFNKDYVAKVIRQGIAEGSLEIGCEASAQAATLLEGQIGTSRFDQTVRRVADLVARDYTERRKG